MFSSGNKRHFWVPYVLLLPGIAWLVAFYIVPIVALVETSLQVQSLSGGADGVVSLGVQNYANAASEYWGQFYRAFVYAMLATFFALLLAYPIAYVIALKAGKYKYLLLMLVIGPFFTNFLIRTLSWGSLLGHGGWVSDFLKFAHIISPTTRLTATPFAVIIGLIYNFFPFMLLPLYANIDRLDRAVISAARDLYSGAWDTFWYVLFPLTMPGIVAGTLLMFIPAFGDFVNAHLLGSTFTNMIGNVVYSQFLVVRDYPLASALSVFIIIFIVAIVFVYTKRAGTDELV